MDYDADEIDNVIWNMTTCIKLDYMDDIVCMVKNWLHRYIEFGWHCVHVQNQLDSCYGPWNCNSTLWKMIIFIHYIIPYVLSTFFLIIMVNCICVNNFIHEHNFVHVGFSLFLFIMYNLFCSQCPINFIHIKKNWSNFIHMGNQLTKENTLFGIWKPCE